MKLREVTAQVGAKLDLPATTIREVLDTTLDLLLEQLVTTGRLEWRGFGSFAVRTHASRKIHNPATGQTITLRPRKTVAFKPSSKIKAKLEPPVDLRARKLRRSYLAKATR